MSERWTVFFSGRVQGVGFRFRTCELAGRFPVTGFVENLEDGRVRLVAEGAPGDLQGFLEAIRGALGRQIVQEFATHEPSKQEFSDFGIRTSRSPPPPPSRVL